MAGSLARWGCDRESIAASRPPSTSDDPRLIRALEAYLEAAEAGCPPDRAAFLADHPEIASGLAGCLEGMEAVREALDRPDPAGDDLTLGLDMGPAPGHAIDLCPSPTVLLGDYRLGRELGRGGMGVVYEAEQQSLGRRVALKVLPFAATLDRRQLRRFRTEAQAAACLQHEHIVPVYAFGTDRGTHFYAMRRVDGCSLAALIARWRGEEDEGAPRADGEADDPDRRGVLGVDPNDPAALADLVASLGIQAAEALGHAHEQGVLHRDVKPGNLLVEPSGHLWVTDFGLARIQARTSLTRSGDLLGTLRYMSPEQARGRHSDIDARADVYSLGATLYELTTRRPLFEGNDASALVEKVLYESPRAPRSLDRRIPRDLETIILKALAKEPADRYGSAAELADDLRRFREDRPIRARRPSAAERAGRWARRHRSAMLAAALVLVVALAAQSATLLMLALESRRARENAARASASGLRLFDMADDLYEQVAEGLGADPAEADARRRLLEASLGIFERFADESAADPTLLARAASALRKAGDIHARLGHHREAALAYTRAIARYEAVGPDAKPPDSARPDELAHVLNRLGNLLLRSGDRHRAVELLARAVEAQQRQVDREASESRDNCGDACLVLISYLADLGRPVVAELDPARADRALTRALALADELADPQPDPGRACADPVTVEQAEALKRVILGRIERGDGRFADALASDRSALDLYRKLAEAHPDRPEFRARASSAAMTLAMGMASSPDPRARDERGALALVRETVESDPMNADLLGAAGVFFMQAGRFSEAERALRSVMDRAPDRADVRNNLAWLLATRSDREPDDPGEAVRLAEQAIGLEPGVAVYWNTLGVAHYRAGRLEAALTSLKTSMDLSGGGDGFDWFVLAMTLYKLGDHDAAAAHYARAVNWMKLLPERDATLSRFREEAESTFRA